VVAIGTFVLLPQHRANTATALAIASRERTLQTAVAELEAENLRLGRDVAQAKRLAADREEQSQAVVVRPSTAVAPQPVPTGKSVAVSPEGRLQWEGKPVTLDEFLVQLMSYQESNEKSRLVVKANGARFMQLNWVLEEARKVGITNLVIESDAQPVGWMNTWFL
jgi:biopolymer transport protein ExbD